MKKLNEIQQMIESCISMDIEYFTLPHTCHELMPYEDDADNITFHKGQETPWICYDLKRCDFETSKEPYYLDWYYTINTHS